MKRLFFILLIAPFLWSCNDDDGYSLDDVWVDIATVENPDGLNTFYLTLDDTTRLWTAATALPGFKPSDGQRIVAYYTILSDKPESAAYDHDIKLTDAYKVLTKGIFNITQATQDSIGNDYIYIEDMWIGSDYLNVEFVYPGYNKTHYINLVSDVSKTYNDGKVHLEFRHNANADSPAYNQWGLVSFNIKSLRTDALSSGSVSIVVHTKEYNKEDQTYNLTYKYGAGASSVKPHKFSVRAEKAVLR
ncbi:MAG: hypothetical protein H6Q20_258 [Bacteroidetes bacterium]|nr:hypothetical protein [Bacteroidota bacterium]